MHLLLSRCREWYILNFCRVIKYLFTYSDCVIRKAFSEMEGWSSNNEFCVKHGHY